MITTSSKPTLKSNGQMVGSSDGVVSELGETVEGEVESVEIGEMSEGEGLRGLR